MYTTQEEINNILDHVKALCKTFNDTELNDLNRKEISNIMREMIIKCIHIYEHMYTIYVPLLVTFENYDKWIDMLHLALLSNLKTYDDNASSTDLVILYSLLKDSLCIVLEIPLKWKQFSKFHIDQCNCYTLKRIR